MPQFPKSFIPDDEEEIGEITAPKSFIPDEKVEEEPKENVISKIWRKVSEPLTDAPTRFAEKVSEYINPERTVRGVKGVGSAYIEGLGHAISGLSSPLNLALTASGIGQGARIPGAAFATKALSAPIVAEGSRNVYRGVRDRDLGETLSGALEAGTGALGFKSHVAAETPKISESVKSEELPIRRSVRTDLDKRPLIDTTPQQDAVAISLTKEGTPRTPANISKETGIPQPSVRRTISELERKSTTEQERIPSRIINELPIRRADKLRNDPYEFAGESIDTVPEQPRDFGYNVRDNENLPRNIQKYIEPSSIKEELPIKEPDVVPPAAQTVEEAKPFVNPFEKNKEVLSDIPNLSGQTLMTGERVRDLMGVEPKEALERGWVEKDISQGMTGYRNIQNKPTAKYMFTQPGFEDIPEQKMYNIEGGKYNKSTVGEARLKELGIDIPDSSIEPIKKPKTFIEDKFDRLKNEDSLSESKNPEWNSKTLNDLRKEVKMSDIDISKFENADDIQSYIDTRNAKIPGIKTLSDHVKEAENDIKNKPIDITAEKDIKQLNSASDEPELMHGGLGGIKPPKKKYPKFEGPAAPALDKLFNTMGGVLENRVKQDLINKTERAKRFAASASVKEEGLAGAAKSLSKLKGEFKKVNLPEGMELNDKEVDSLFTAVKKAKLTEPEKTRGRTALFALLNGDRLPQRNELEILNDVFGNGFANRITEMHGGIGLVGLKLTKTANTMKALMYSSDLSMGLRQGIGMVHRPEWRNAMKEQLKYLAKPEYFEAAMEAIESHPKYLLSKESGLFIAKPGGLISGEEAFMDNYVSDLPKGVAGLYVRDVTEASERAYVGGLNKLRFDLFNNLTTLAEKSGNKVFEVSEYVNTEDIKIINRLKKFAKENGISTDIENPEFIELAKKNNLTKTVQVPTEVAKNIAKYINVFTGRGGLGQLEKIKGTMNFVFGSPRMLSSRLTALNPKFYSDLDPFTRKEALKSLLAVAAASTVINTLGAMAGGKVSLDILSSDFMKTRFASGNVVDPSGSFQQPIVAAARMIGELNRMASGRKLKSGERTIPQIAGDFIANKLSPMVGLAYELASANRFTGGGNYVDRFGSKKNVLSETGKRFVSIFSQDMYNLLSSDPSFAETVGLPPLLLLGVGEQNYPERKPGTRLRKMRLP